MKNMDRFLESTRPSFTAAILPSRMRFMQAVGGEEIRIHTFAMRLVLLLWECVSLLFSDNLITVLTAST